MKLNFNDNFKSARRGFTLIELLFVVAIIAVLGSMAAGILAKAQKDAKVAATRSRITQIEAIMQTVSEDFEVRRLPFRNAQLVSQSGATTRTEVRNLRRRITAALIQAEFPGPLFDAASNVFITNPGIGTLTPTGTPPIDSTTPIFRDWLDNTYNSTFRNSLEGEVITAEMRYWQGLASNPLLDQPGEYLYLILQRIDIDGKSALETLGRNIVGNTDGDIFPEIVDGFGDSLHLRIVQVAATGDGGGRNEIWTDVPEAQINWKQSSLIGATSFKIPNGYQFLNPVIPRSINKIRFQVVSPNLEEIE